MRCGQTTGYAEKRVLLGGGSGSASEALGNRATAPVVTPASTGTITSATHPELAQDETPHGPSQAAPMARQSPDAMASGADSTDMMTARTATTARLMFIPRLL